MTIGEALDLVGIMLGLMVFPGIPLAVLFWVGLYYLIAYRTLGVRRRRRLGWPLIVGCFVMGFVLVAMTSCVAARRPSDGGWAPLGGAPDPIWIT